MPDPGRRLFASTLAACAAATCLFFAARAAAHEGLEQPFADTFSLHRLQPSAALGQLFGRPKNLVGDGPFAQAGQNGRSGQADADADGVPDAQDACPREPGVKSSDAETSGCAAKLDAGKVKDKAEVVFSGYRSLPGGRGVIFVELTDAVAVEVTRAGPVIEYKLVGATVPLKNNLNPLLLRDFSSSATTARLVPEKRARARAAGQAAKRQSKTAPSVRLVITLRANVSPAHRMVLRGNAAVLEVELPPLPGG